MVALIFIYNSFGLDNLSSRDSDLMIFGKFPMF